MNNNSGTLKMLIVAGAVVALVAIGYVIYKDQQSDVEINLPGGVKIEADKN